MGFSNTKRYSKQTWDQLKNITKAELINALDKDPNWEFNRTNGSRYIYVNLNNPPDSQEISVHFHAIETYRNMGLLRNILKVINWTEDDLKSLKLIKKK